MELRPYQKDCVKAAYQQLKSSIEPFIVEAATGAGKSLLIAEIARMIHEFTGKRVLCTAPSAELVVQNHAKYEATGNPASMFSASAGQKSLAHSVVFGTPLTIKNKISAFKKDFALIIIDECDQITPTVKAIIDEMREGNQNLRVMGLTATPYRLGSGYIFREWEDGKINGDDCCVEPYFTKCVYRITARELIDQGYLTKPVVGAINAEGYDTSKLLLNKRGQFNAEDVDHAFVGHGRKTAAIVGDIVYQSRGRRGVLIYAATVRHAEEVLASLPHELSAIITADTKNRKEILDKFKRQEIKYIVNVAVLTVGVDLPHVNVIAVLRKSESVRLLQQIIGRGLRLFEGKEDCLYLDYTDNGATHFPDGDLFDPVITARKTAGDGTMIKALCAECGYENHFKLNPDYADYTLNEHGYCLDTFGAPIETEYGPLAGHYGRRCFGYVRTGEKGQHERCGYRWAGKECPQCGELNDISARYCCDCKAEIVDPGEKLVADFRALKRDPTKPQCDKVLGMTCKKSISQKGNETLRVDWVTPFRQFSIWLMPNAQGARQKADHERFVEATRNGPPETISYVKEASTSFYRVLAYNRPADEEPVKDKAA